MTTWFQFKSATKTQYGSGSEGEARRYFRDLDSPTSLNRYVMSELPLGDMPPQGSKQVDMAVELAKTARAR